VTALRGGSVSLNILRVSSFLSLCELERLKLADGIVLIFLRCGAEPNILSSLHSAAIGVR